MGREKNREEGSMSTRSRPQYHYFYGATDSAADSVAESHEQEQESLIGEVLVSTDNEEETPTNSAQDFQHLLITNGDSSKWLFGPSPQDRRNSIGLGRTVLLILLVAAMSLLFAFILLPKTPTTRIPAAQTVLIPFEQVNRGEYGDPVEGFIDMDLFHPTLLSDSEPRSFQFPFPTGAFWTNLIVPSPEDGASYPIVVYPYAYKWTESSLQLSYPFGHRVVDKHSVVDNFEQDLTIYTLENISHRHVTKFDPLSVTLRFVATVDSKWETSLVQGSPYSTMKYLNATPVFRAMTTFKSVQCPGDDDENFSDLLDDDEGGKQRSLFGVCSVKESSTHLQESSPGKTTLRGVQFIFKTPESNWIMFASEPMNLVFDSQKKTTISSSVPFTGVVRIAYIPAKDPTDQSTETSTGLRRLIYHAGSYPVGGQVSWEFPRPTNSKYKSTVGKSTSPRANDSSRVATVHFNYATSAMSDNSLRTNAAADTLLMLALPHHAQLLPKSMLLNAKHFDLHYRCIKGRMTPVVGSTWSYDEPFPDLEFDAPMQGMDPLLRQTLLDQLEEDITLVLPTATENIYGFGKQVARLAQITHIAYQLGGSSGETASDDQASGILEQASSLLSEHLGNLLSGDVADGLVFDSNLGGVVSKNGLSNKEEDFGNGRYNDHHFHYGYILYASAVMGKIDPSFIDHFATYVDAIFHDIAHSMNADSRDVPATNVFFPLARHKSWFDGHSFATGMFPFATGKSQESSSEAVNCYYGAYLWSLVRQRGSNILSDRTDFTRLLLAMEIRGAKTYWHMTPPAVLLNNSDASGIYPPKFQENYMVGNVGMLDVAANTWFGADPLYVHMINAIPITAATALLFEKGYVEEEYPFLMKSRDGVEMAWRGYADSIHSIIDPNLAWEEAQDLVSSELDSALSKSQVLYFISLRPGFDRGSSGKGGEKSNSTTSSSNKHVNPSYSNTTPPSNGDGKSMAASSCENHAECYELDLHGFCCPTASEEFLECCSR